LTRIAQGAIALVGDSVRGTSLAPPLVDKVGFGGTESPSAREPASKNVEPGSLMTEFDWEEMVVCAGFISRTVSTERPGWIEGGKSDDSARDAVLMAIGSEGFSVDVSLVLANLSAIAPFWFFSTVSIAGFTFPRLISIVGSAIVGFAGAALPPKLICLRNQLPGRGFASTLAPNGNMALGVDCPVSCEPTFLGGE
jgi:hypothetical protein